MTSTVKPMGFRSLFSAVKRWQHRLNALIASALNWMSKAWREKHRQELSEEAQRRKQLAALRDRLRNRLPNGSKENNR